MESKCLVRNRLSNLSYQELYCLYFRTELGSPLKFLYYVTQYDKHIFQCHFKYFKLKLLMVLLTSDVPENRLHLKEKTQNKAENELREVSV